MLPCRTSTSEARQQQHAMTCCPAALPHSSRAADPTRCRLPGCHSPQPVAFGFPNETANLTASATLNTLRHSVPQPLSAACCLRLRSFQAPHRKTNQAPHRRPRTAPQAPHRTAGPTLQIGSHSPPHAMAPLAGPLNFGPRICKLHSMVRFIHRPTPWHHSPQPTVRVVRACPSSCEPHPSSI